MVLLSALRTPGQRAVVLVWGVWALMLLAALAFVWQYGSQVVPYGDEWGYIPYLTGEEAVTPAFLWQPHAEHRIPVAKLIWIGMLKLTRGDFRVGMFLNVLAVAALAAAMMEAARRQRGRTSYADAFIPLVSLHVGQSTNFLWWWQINE